MRLLDSIVVLVLISGCTDPRPMPSALTARVHPAPDELQLDSRTNRLHVGERVSLWLEAASFEVRSTAKAPGLRLTALPGPFHFQHARQRGGTLTYTDGPATLVLTPGLNGVKEDLLLAKPVADSLTLRWQLDLEPGLEAHLEPNGGITISHRAQRRYEIPAPTVRDANGVETREGLHFSLAAGTLTLHAQGLASLAYPIDIDPTVITTSPDFAQGGNLESDVVNMAGQLSRQPPSNDTSRGAPAPPCRAHEVGTPAWWRVTTSTSWAASPEPS